MVSLGRVQGDGEDDGWDAQIFYSEMRDLVPERDRPVADKVINEEKSHVRLLSGIKKKFA
jgi:rubrerythrin